MLTADPTDGGYDFIPVNSTATQPSDFGNVPDIAVPSSGGDTLNTPGFFSGLTNAFSGVLSKTIETAGDTLATQGANKILGIASPTGQVNPDAVKTAAAKAKADAAAAPISNQTLLIIGGAVLVGLLGIALVTRKAA